MCYGLNLFHFFNCLTFFVDFFAFVSNAFLVYNCSLDFLHQKRHARSRIAASEEVEFKLFRLDVDTNVVIALEMLP